jgi:hypothetical protein
MTADRDTIDGLIEALCEAHNEGLHEDAAQQSCPICQEDDEEEEAAFAQASQLP